MIVKGFLHLGMYRIKPTHLLLRVADAFDLSAVVLVVGLHGRRRVTGLHGRCRTRVGHRTKHRVDVSGTVHEDGRGRLKTLRSGDVVRVPIYQEVDNLWVLPHDRLLLKVAQQAADTPFVL